MLVDREARSLDAQIAMYTQLQQFPFVNDDITLQFGYDFA